MPVTNAAISTDKTEYCKYRSDMKVITVTMRVTAGTIVLGEQYKFEVRRERSLNWPDAYSTVMSTIVTATSGDASNGYLRATFTIGIDDVDADGIARLLAAEYLVRVFSVENSSLIWYAKVPIRISLVTMREIRDDWCYGVPLRTSEITGVKFQPKAITGVTIDELSSDTSLGIKSLVLAYSSGSWLLSWDGGSSVLVSSDTKTSYLLMDEGDANYISVTVDPILLPTASVTEKILVVQNEMTDGLIYRRIDNAMDSIESQLGFPLEPYLYTTMPLRPGDAAVQNHMHDHWDRIGRASDYFVPTGGLSWPNFKLPYQWVLKIHDLYGLHQVDKLIQVQSQWFTTTVDRISGFVTLVPSLGSIAQWTVFTHPMLAPFYMFYGFGNIPAFWNYSATIGLPDLLDRDRAIVRELIARTAAASILIEAQRGYQGGLGSQSTSRDGLSSSFSYNPQGPYGSTIAEHRQWIATETPRIKTKLGGLSIVTLGS